MVVDSCKVRNSIRNTISVRVCMQQTRMKRAHRANEQEIIYEVVNSRWNWRFKLCVCFLDTQKKRASEKVGRRGRRWNRQPTSQPSRHTRTRSYAYTHIEKYWQASWNARSIRSFDCCSRVVSWETKSRKTTHHQMSRNSRKIHLYVSVYCVWVSI